MLSQIHKRWPRLPGLLGPLLGLALLTALPSQAAVPENSSFSRLPLGFQKNLGQAPSPTRYLLRGPGHRLYLSPTGARLEIRLGGKRTLRTLELTLLDSNPEASLSGASPREGKVNYLVGPRDKWITGVPVYGRVTQRGVYPGVDMVYYGSNGRLEYDFNLEPGADHRRIRLSLSGQDRLTLDPEGNLRAGWAEGEVVLNRPVSYQIVEGARQPVDSRFVLLAGGRVGFELGQHRADAPLVIDPIMVFSTFLGGAGSENAEGVHVDEAGYIYLAGVTSTSTESKPDFPTTPGAFQTGNAYDGSGGGDWEDAFVTKLAPSGQTLVYSTYLGGFDEDHAQDLAVDHLGRAVVAGWTRSPDFPTTTGALSGTFGGGDTDAFVTMLSPDGSSILYSTYLGGTGNDKAYGVAVDAQGNAAVAGETSSPDTSFPIRNPVVYGSFNGGQSDGGGKIFMTRFNETGGLIYSTYLGGGAAYSVDCSPTGSAYSTGQGYPPIKNAFQPNQNGGGDAFVAKLGPAGELAFASFYGGSSWEASSGVGVDSQGFVHIGGKTYSSDLPLKNAVQTQAGGESDGFAAKISPDGLTLVYSTYLGGEGNDGVHHVELDPLGNAFYAGDTFSSNYPVLPGATQAVYGGSGDAFFTGLSPDGLTMLLSTFLGGSGQDYGTYTYVDAWGNAFITGYTSSSDFPTLNAFQAAKAGGQDAFLAKFSAVEAPPPLVGLGGGISGQGKDGVILVFQGAGRTLSRTDGRFAMALPQRWGGSIIPYKHGVAFNPPYRVVGRTMTTSQTQGFEIVVNPFPWQAFQPAFKKK